MISQTLRDARRYEDAMAQNITPLERPEFHLSPKVGWMNDPNGFSYYKDKFHLFRHLPDGSMIRTVFPFTMEKSICFTSIIHMIPSGDQCTGDMR